MGTDRIAELFFPLRPFRAAESGLEPLPLRCGLRPASVLEVGFVVRRSCLRDFCGSLAAGFLSESKVCMAEIFLRFAGNYCRTLFLIEIRAYKEFPEKPIRSSGKKNQRTPEIKYLTKIVPL